MMFLSYTIPIPCFGECRTTWVSTTNEEIDLEVLHLVGPVKFALTGRN